MDMHRTPTTTSPLTLPIPQPRTVPLLGNLPLLDVDTPAQSLHTLARTHGPVFRMSFPGRSFIVVSDFAHIDEACDTTRFSKDLPAPLIKLRDLGGDGLFTAYNDEPNWALAHRILMPAFSLDAMRGYHDRMLDVGLQMVDRWARMRPDETINVPETMTRLTLDVIALCGFDYRLNSFYHDEMHPFVHSMVGALDEAMRADNRPRLLNLLMVGRRAQFQRDVADMHGLVERLIEERRRAQPDGSTDATDLLGLMLTQRDPLTGRGLSDENIRNQIVTFLIAGHETTSSLLSFTLHFLSQHPALYQRAVDEVDRVIGSPENLPRFEQLHDLTFLEQLLFEALRLWPPAPGFVVSPNATTTLGRHTVTPDDKLLILLSALHRDPAVWGPDANRFDPDRFSPEQVAARPANAFKPFGNGMRACIGRQFAMQEAKLTLALILQRFSLSHVDPSATLDVGETLTFKPRNLHMRAHLRDAVTTTSLLMRATTAPDTSESTTTDAQPAVEPHGHTLLVGYGSNMGSTRQFAERLAHDARRSGYTVEVVALDDLVERDLRAPIALMLLSASYNGHPPDNAAHFCAWLERLTPGALNGVTYTLFGCGHRDWAATFQAVPARIDARLQALGATRLHTRGEGDGRGDIVAHFDGWTADMWPTLHDHAGVDIDTPDTPTPSLLEVELLETPTATPDGALPMTVLDNRELVDMSAPFARSKRHIELALPPNTTYAAGDHLIVMPINDAARVQRFATRLGWDLDQVVVLRAPDGAAPRTLPIGRPIALGALLTRHLELGRPAYTRHLERLLPHTPCPPERARLQAWCDDTDTPQHRSIIDVLDALPSANPPLDLVLSLLEPLTPRTYSIASSPALHPDSVHLTISVLDAPSRSGSSRFLGVCSNHLARLRPGDRIWAEIATPQPAFCLPEDPSTPVLLLSAGTGFAPMRGFLQEREAAREAGHHVGPTLVFTGCDRADVDLLYANELEAWRDSGLIELYTAESESNTDVRFVQHRLWAERERVSSLFDAGLHILVCGDGRYMAPAVRETLQRMQAPLDGPVRYDEDAWAG